MKVLAIAMMVALATLSAGAVAPNPSRAYAILVNGGSRQSGNHLRFWGDMALAYDTFRHDFGVPREQIKVLWASGDPLHDMCLANGPCVTCGRGRLPFNPADLDRDGVGDIDGPATPDSIEAAFAEFGGRLTADDQLFVFFTDHGTTYGYEDYADYVLDPLAGLLLWNRELLPDWRLAEWARNLPCPVVFALETCYSGGMIADLMDSPGIRFVATASEYVSSHAGETAPYFNQWSYQFLSALRGRYPKDRTNPLEHGSPCLSDADGDGVVSFREASRFAYFNRCAKDYPQYAEPWSGCGRLLSPIPRMDANEWAACAAEHLSERRGFLGLRHAYRLKFADGAVSPESDGAVEFASERLTVQAPPTSVDQKGNDLAFQCWKLSPADVDLGPAFDATSPETVFYMPAKALTLTPVYLPTADGCHVTLHAAPDRSDHDPAGAFRWSPDGKTWYRSEDTAVLPQGSKTLRWKSLSTAWKAPTAKTKVKLSPGDAYDNAGNPAVFTYVPLVAVRVMTLKDGKWTGYAESGTVRISPVSSGRVNPGRKVTLTASSRKGFVFAGWTSEDRTLDNHMNQKQTFLMPSNDVNLVARFVTKADDAASMALSVGDRELTEGTVSSLATNVMCGVQCSLPVLGVAASKVTLTASGLPSGLSLKKDVTSGRYVISGTPTSAKSTASKVKFKLRTAGSNVKSYRMEIAVDPLPNWAYGAFAGYIASKGAEDVGATSLTVSSSGKISGKLTLAGTNWTYQVKGFVACQDADLATNRCFRVEAVAKSGRHALPVDLVVTPGWMTEDADRLNCAVATGTVGEDSVELHRNIWSDKGLDVELPQGLVMLDEQGFPGVKAKVSRTGQVAFSGKLDGQVKVSASTTAFLEPDGAVRAFLIVPRSKKFTQALFSLVDFGPISR